MNEHTFNNGHDKATLTMATIRGQRHITVWIREDFQSPYSETTDHNFTDMAEAIRFLQEFDLVDEDGCAVLNPHLNRDEAIEVLEELSEGLGIDIQVTKGIIVTTVLIAGGDERDEMNILADGRYSYSFGDYLSETKQATYHNLLEDLGRFL